MSDFEQKLITLLSSPHYHELAAYKPPFDPFDVMGVSGRELSYSSVLSWLLGDPANKAFRQKFVSSIAPSLGNALDAGRDEPIDVKPEYGDDEAGRIDVFVHLPSLNLAVAIEVKVWADEGSDQISRYQDFLARKYPHCTKVVVFLTRLGNPPTTACPASDVPVLNMCWRKIADIIDECSGQGEEHDFCAQFRKHIYRSLLMDRDERRMVIDLLHEGDNIKTMRKIIDNYPDLGDEEYVEKWKRIVADVISENATKLELEIYPSRGKNKKELKIGVPKWTDAGLPFTLMLYNYKNSAVRVMLHEENYDRARGPLDEFSKSSEGIVGRFPKIAGWNVWHSVLASDGTQEEVQKTIIGPEIFEAIFWEQVEKKLRSQLVPLLPLINGWLTRKPPS